MTSYVLTYRLVKGSPLTEGEFDGNIHNLDDRVTVVEASGTAWVVDAQINTAGHLEIILSNNVVIDAGPLPAPGSIAITYKGAWLPTTAYHQNDLFTAPGSKWLGAVLRDHTSASSFDWGANDGFGHNDYMVVLPLSPAETTVTLSTTSHTLTLDDNNCFILCTGVSTGGTAITIPTNASVPFPLDTEISFSQDTTHPVHFSPAGGVTLHYPTDCNPVTAVEYGVVTLKQVATDQWRLFGRLQQVTG